MSDGIVKELALRRSKETAESFQFRRRDRSDSGITLEVGYIESKQTRDPVDRHRSYELGVMNIDTHHRMSYDKPSPFLKRRQTVWEQAKVAFNQTCFSFSFSQ